MKHVRRMWWLSLALYSGAIPASFAQCRFPETISGRLLTYSFEPSVAANAAVLHITLTFQGDRDGAERIEAPTRWAGETLRGLVNLRAVSAGATVTDDPGGRKTVHYPPNKPVVLAWDMVKDWTGQFTHPLQFHGVVTPEYLEINGANALVYPELDSRARVTVRFDWRKLPASWILATSFGAGSDSASRCQSYSGPWDAVVDALFAAGDFRLHEFRIGAQPAVLAIRGQWSFTDDQAIAGIAKAVQIVRTFWHDDNFPYFLVTVKPYDTDHGQSDGSAFTNAFWLYLSRLDPLSTQLTVTMAHEAFHAWNPHRMGVLREEDAATEWFSEGFTQYYGYLLVERAGLMPLPDYLASINDYLRKRPSSHDPYAWGRLTALWLDAQIRKDTHGKNSLDDVMFEMLRGRDQPLTTDRVLETAGHYLAPDARLRLDQIVRQGGAAPAPDSAPGSCAHVRMEELPTFDLGFDFDASAAAHRVIGVRPDGLAYQAGLREGQPLQGWSVYNGDTSKIAKFTIQTAAGRHTIEYYPKGKPVVLPQYYLDEQAYARDPAACRVP